MRPAAAMRLYGPKLGLREMILDPFLHMCGKCRDLPADAPPHEPPACATCRGPVWELDVCALECTLCQSWTRGTSYCTGRSESWLAAWLDSDEPPTDEVRLQPCIGLEPSASPAVAVGVGDVAGTTSS